MRQWRFRPGLASTAMLILLFPVLVSLGFWQLDRGAQKARLGAQLAANREAPEWHVTSAGELRRTHQPGRAMRVTGDYQSPSILLDNRTRDGRSGYEVLTPFRLTDGTRLLVARGWIAAGADRMHAPEVDSPAGQWTLHGRVGKAPVSGVPLARSDDIEKLASALLRVQRLDAAILSRALGDGLPEDVIYLDPAAPNGYDRRWPETTSDVSRHHAYAVQWFAMAGVLLLLYLKINLRRVAS